MMTVIMCFVTFLLLLESESNFHVLAATDIISSMIIGPGLTLKITKSQRFNSCVFIWSMSYCVKFKY